MEEMFYDIAFPMWQFAEDYQPVTDSEERHESTIDHHQLPHPPPSPSTLVASSIAQIVVASHSPRPARLIREASTLEFPFKKDA